jgi:hypothetical protein
LDPAFFADDGLFFKHAVERGWHSLFEPYQGQLFLTQRAFAVVAEPLSAVYQPAIYWAAAVAAAVASCSFVLSSRLRVPAPFVLRCLCFAALLCSPAVDEAFASLTMAHWWLAIGLVVVGMLHDPRRGRLRIAEYAFTLVTALSGFAALYALPILGARALSERSRHSLVLLGVAAGGVLVQIGYLIASPRRGDVGQILAEPGTALLVLVKRVFGTAALGDVTLAEIWPQFTTEWWVWLITMALVGALVAVWARSARLESTAMILCLLGGWLVVLWPMTQPGGSLEILITWPTSASRYFLVPIATIFVSLLLPSQPPASDMTIPDARRVSVALACLLVSVGILTDYHLAPPPGERGDWAAFAACMERGTVACSTVIPPGWPLEVNPRGGL